jgi:hypothetical protein
LAHEFVPHRGTGWDYALESIRGDSDGQAFFQSIEGLGETTAELHLALAAAGLGLPALGVAGLPPHDGLGKVREILQVACNDRVHDLPIDGAVVMHGDVAKSNGLLELSGQHSCDHAHLRQLLKGFTHGGGSWPVLAGCNVCANVNRHLHGAGQVQGDDVLEVKVVAELVGIKRLFGFDAQEAASK